MRFSPVKSIKRFAADRRGSFGVMFGLVSIGLVTAAGMSVDLARLYSAQGRLNLALDAAVLSTTRNITLGVIEAGDARRVVRNFILTNIDRDDFHGARVRIDTVRINQNDKTLEVAASVDLPMTLSRIVGVPTWPVSTGSKAKFSDTNVEVAMALDVTGSMDDPVNPSDPTSPSKIAALKDAANDGIGALIPNAAAARRVRIGLVPYAAYVNASPVIDEINHTGQSSGCVFERTGSQRFTNVFATPGNPVGGTQDWCPSSEILPLTNNRTLLENRINAFSTGGCTAGHIAIAWSWYMLSSRWNTAWPAGADAAPPTDTGTRKYAVIMTDGIFNTHPSSGNICTQDGKAQSRSYALGLCDAMRREGIKVYTIAFAAPSDAADLMEDCATPVSAGKSHYFNATDEVGLQEAFLAIAEDILNLRLVN